MSACEWPGWIIIELTLLVVWNPIKYNWWTFYHILDSHKCYNNKTYRN